MSHACGRGGHDATADNRETRAGGHGGRDARARDDTLRVREWWSRSFDVMGVRANRHDGLVAGAETRTRPRRGVGGGRRGTTSLRVGVRRGVPTKPEKGMVGMGCVSTLLLLTGGAGAVEQGYYNN